MNKKNIAFVIYSLNSGGAERVVSTLANGLSIYFNVSIITFTDIKPFYQLNGNVNVTHCFNNLQPSKNFIESLKTNYALYKKIKKTCKVISVDLLIGFMTNTNIISILASKSLNIPVIVSERIHPEFSELPTFWRLMREFTYPKADILVIQTEPIKKFFTSFVPNEKLKILSNPISSIHEKLKHKVSIPKENIVLNVGRLSQQKGQEIAIKAFTKLNPIDWELHLVGEGPNKDYYNKLITDYGMEDKIKLIGRNNNISEYYLKSSIFVFPSRFEGFPNALTEAMYMGLPSISTDCPTGPSELITDGENGYLIEMEDSKALASKMEELIANKVLRTQIGNNAAKSVEHLNESKVVKKWKELIDQTINL